MRSTLWILYRISTIRVSFPSLSILSFEWLKKLIGRVLNYIWRRIINGSNISEVWTAANALLEERLIRECVVQLKPSLESIITDCRFLQDTSPLGMSHLLSNLDASSTADLSMEKQLLEGWLSLDESIDRSKKLKGLIDTSSLAHFSVGFLFFIFKKVVEYSLPKQYQ